MFEIIDNTVEFKKIKNDGEDDYKRLTNYICLGNDVQMSDGAGSDLLGDTAAMSLTTDVHSDFTKSFTEHGFVLGVMVARYDHTYQQGLERFWSRKDRFDYYWPVFANIGEQAVKNEEIYATGTATDDQVFGYQEAWADYRYKPLLS